MSDAQFHLLLPAEQKFFAVEDVAHLTATTMWPEAKNEPNDKFMNRCACIVAHERFLADAVRRGDVAALNPLTHVPESAPVGERLKLALISRADFVKFAGFLSIELDNLDEKLANTFGYTIKEAAKTIAEKYGVAEDTVRDLIFDAAVKGHIEFKHPETGQEYIPAYRRDYYERISSTSITNLNACFKKCGIEYRLDLPPNDDKQSAALPRGVSKNDIIGKFCRYRDPDLNERYWRYKLSDPPKWLRSARISSGGKGVSALWNPLLFAHALLGRRAMTPKALDKVMREGFPNLFAQWQEETTDADR